MIRNAFFVRVRSVFVVTALLLSSSFTTANAGDAPDFSLSGPDGSVNLQDYAGQIVYVDFWASWCAPCRKSFPWMNDLLSTYEADGLKIVAINLDSTSSDAKEFLAATSPNFDIAFDPQANTAESYNVLGMPSSFLIDRNGDLLFSHVGFRKKDTTLIEKAIEKALRNPL